MDAQPASPTPPAPRARSASRDARAALRARLAELRAKLKAAVRERTARKKELVDIFRTERKALKEELRERRRRALQKLDDEVRAAREEVRLKCLAELADARKRADSEIATARAAVEIERKKRAEHAKIDAHAASRRKAIHAEHDRAASTGSIAASVLGAYGPLFERIALKASPAPGESRGEALLRHAETHAEEAHAVLEPRAEKAIEQTKAQIAAVETAIRTAAPDASKRPRLSVVRGGGAPEPRKKGQLPRSGGILVADLLLRERAELAAEKAKRQPKVAAVQPEPTAVAAPAPKRPEDSVKAPELRDTAEIAKRIRDDIKEAVNVVELPRAKYSVTTDKYSMGSSIQIIVSGLPFPVLDAAAHRLTPSGHLEFDRERYKSRYSAEARRVHAQLEAIIRAYHWDRSDPASDYYNSRFHYDIRFGDEAAERERLEKEWRRPSPSRTPSSPPATPPTSASTKSVTLTAAQHRDLKLAADRSAAGAYVGSWDMASSSVAHFKRQGWIERVVDGMERAGTVYRITDAGRQALGRGTVKR